MPTEKELPTLLGRNVLGHYLESRYKMSPEEFDGHKNFVLRKLEQLSKGLTEKEYKRETVLAVAFSPNPIHRDRHIDQLKDHKIILDSKTNYTLADDKLEFPSIFDNEFVFGIKTNKRTLIHRMYSRYKWNNADIIGIIQIIVLCSKDDRRITLGSGIHDFLLEFKYEIYNDFLKQSPDLTIDEFRWITSDTFRWIIKSEGMGPIKSKVMSNIMDCFQKKLQKKKWIIEIDE